MVPTRQHSRCLAIIVACMAGGYTGFCVGFIVLSVDAAWKGILQPGYEAQWGIFAGIFYACIAGAVGGVIGISRFRVYLGWLGFGALLLWLCWFVYESWIYWPPVTSYNFAGRVVGLTILTDAALAGAVGVAIAKHMTNSPRLQFNLKTLLLLVTMCAVACGLSASGGNCVGSGWIKNWLRSSSYGPRNAHAQRTHWGGLQCVIQSGWHANRLGQ